MYSEKAITMLGQVKFRATVKYMRDAVKQLADSGKIRQPPVVVPLHALTRPEFEDRT
jgi:hypothetical protein